MLAGQLILRRSKGLTPRSCRIPFRGALNSSQNGSYKVTAFPCGFGQPRICMNCGFEVVRILGIEIVDLARPRPDASLSWLVGQLVENPESRKIGHGKAEPSTPYGEPIPILSTANLDK